MSDTAEATVNPDGSTTFDEEPPIVDDQQQQYDDTVPPPGEGEEPLFEEIVKGTDPALYFLVGILAMALLWYFFVYRRKSVEGDDDFFSNLDGDKFNLKLPAEVDEYYAIKEKCEAAGWEPGKPPAQGQTANGPHRMMAQALMKRAIADLPIVQHIQKESTGMNKLYSQSMCSVKQWRAYQAAESLVSAEVDEVRAEADEVEQGWSQVIWRQAMQYHNMLKQKHEAEAKAALEAATKKKALENVVTPEQKKAAEELAAEQAVQDLLKAEDREMEGKKAFKGGMKKGFLDSGSKSSKKK